jgi:hypothetical protein
MAALKRNYSVNIINKSINFLCFSEDAHGRPLVGTQFRFWAANENPWAIAAVGHGNLLIDLP